MEELKVVRESTAQATTGQTDTVQVPSWADTAALYVDLSAVAGTTPLFDLKLQYVDPVSGAVEDFQWNGVTQLTAAGQVVVNISRSGFDTEDDTATIYFLKDILPSKFNIVTTLDRTTGDETYTYSISVVFRD